MAPRAFHLGVVPGADLDAFAVLEVVNGEGVVVDDHGVAGSEALRDVFAELELLLDEQHGVRVVDPGLQEVVVNKAAVIVGDGGHHLPGVQVLRLCVIDGLAERGEDVGELAAFAGGVEGHLEFLHEVGGPASPALLEGDGQQGLGHAVGDGAFLRVGGVLAGDLRLQPGGRRAGHPAFRSRRSEDCVSCRHGVMLLISSTCRRVPLDAPAGIRWTS